MSKFKAPSLHFKHKHPAAKMVLVPVAIGGMLGLALASPFPEANPEAQISLPPLIPSVPGFTDPIAQNAPPLPVLQVPTPPLASPPFQGSDIKPKKIGYFWTGAGDNQHKGISLMNRAEIWNLVLTVVRFFGNLQSG